MRPHTRLLPSSLQLTALRRAAPRPAAAVAAVAALGWLGGCSMVSGWLGPSTGPDGQPLAVSCGSLAGALRALPGLPPLRISRSDMQAADAKGHPAHCLVQGSVNERTGIDGQRYAIRFEMRLPVAAAWNQRFLHQMNGGNDGVVKPALGDLAVLAEDALQRGFAVLSSDGGHDGDDPAHASAGLLKGNLFGLDPQARRDYGYTASDALWPVAQALMASHYAQAPQRNYMAGCSNGGRQAMVAANRQAARYDGFLAGAPGFNLPKASLQHAWDLQSWRLANADIRQAFSAADLKLVADHVLARCDGLDQLVDGIVSDVKRCQGALHLDQLRCQPGQAGNSGAGCLDERQLSALERAFGGAKNSRGEALYSDFPFDTGIAAPGWRAWKLQSSVPAWDRNPIIATMGAGSLAYVFSTPPNRVAGTPAALLDSLLRFDFDRDAPKIFAAQPPYTESAMAFMTPPDAANPTLAALRQRKGKLLIYHGSSDPVFSVNDSGRWVEKLQANLGASGAGDVARVFAVPGMGHCQGGPATDRFDALGALVNWVEKGQAPDRITASLSPQNKDVPSSWPAQRSRPLCPWPLVARYAGGDVEAAASFRCAAP